MVLTNQPCHNLFDDNHHLLPLDGPATLVATHQAVWRVPSTQGRLIHLQEVEMFEQEFCFMFPRVALR